MYTVLVQISSLMDMAVQRGNINNACSQNRMTKVEIKVGGRGQ